MAFNQPDDFQSVTVQQPVYQTIVQSQPEAVQTYAPAILGSTTDPTAVAYIKQNGRYVLRGKWCQFTIDIVTSSITKPSNLNDAIRISLPFMAANNGVQSRFSGMAWNALPIQGANSVLLTPATNFLSLQQFSLGGLAVNLTFSLLTGIGVLTNQIYFQASGAYEIE